MPSTQTAANDRVQGGHMRTTLNSEGVSKWRLILLRTYYVVIFVLLGSETWPEIFTRGGSWQPLAGIAFSFWAALSTLAILGLRYPLRMLPLLLLQMLYKTTWLLGVALPLWKTGKFDQTAHSLFVACAVGVVLDLIVIPWRYVLESYVLKPKN